MLYRHKQGTFEICHHKAVYTAVVKKVVEDGFIEIDGEQVMQYREIEVEEPRETFVYDKERFERTLRNSSEHYKEFHCERVRLSEEQYNRFKQIRNLPESSISNCLDYINGGEIPKELENLQLAQELTEREINEIKQGQIISDLEIKLYRMECLLNGKI